MRSDKVLGCIRITHTHTHIYIYIYIYVCVCVCVCVMLDAVHAYFIRRMLFFRSCQIYYCIDIIHTIYYCIDIIRVSSLISQLRLLKFNKFKVSIRSTLREFYFGFQYHLKSRFK